MIEKLKTKKNTRLFFFAVIATIVCLILLRIICTLNLSETPSAVTKYLLDLLDKFIISTIVSVALATFIYWLSKDSDDSSAVWVIDPEDIGGFLKKSRKETELWFFSGGSGSYTRTQTLPYLAKLAGKKSIRIPVTIQIMNPKNGVLCKKYADYRNSLDGVKEDDKKTQKSVQMDILATVVSAYMWKTEQPKLEICLGWRDTFSMFRTDLSSKNAVITKENPKDSALVYNKGSIFYDGHLEDLKRTFEVIHNCDMKIIYCKKDEMSVANTKALLESLGLENILKTDHDVQAVINRVNSNKNSYA